MPTEQFREKNSDTKEPFLTQLLELTVSADDAKARKRQATETPKNEVKIESGKMPRTAWINGVIYGDSVTLCYLSAQSSFKPFPCGCQTNGWKEERNLHFDGDVMISFLFLSLCAIL